jgi:beta-glucosidase
METHKDSEGRNYRFGYGMNWKGEINDARTKKYKNRKGF